MRTAIVLTVIILALIVGGLLTLRRSARTGMPSRDILERATRRAQELEKREQMKEDE
jgi:hypothetical protein